MVEPKIMYQLKCDRCGTIYRNGTQQFFMNEESVIYEAAEDGWYVDDKIRCPKCCKLDGYGEAEILKPLLPYTVWKVEEFLKSIAFGVVSSLDDETFIIKFSLFDDRLEESVRTMIDSILGKMTHSVEFNETEGKTSLIRASVSITVRQFVVGDEVCIIRCKKKPELIGKTGKVTVARNSIDEYSVEFVEGEDTKSFMFVGEDLEKIKD